MGRALEIESQETASDLKDRYRRERNSERKVRLYAFWQLLQRKTLKDAAELAGIGYRTLQEWLAWYRHEGLTEVLRRIKGHGHQGRPAKLNTIQQKALVARAALGNFCNVWEVIEWVQDRWKVQYTYSGLLSCLKRLKCHLKIPSPCSVKADDIHPAAPSFRTLQQSN
jgi:transposase